MTVLKSLYMTCIKYIFILFLLLTSAGKIFAQDSGKIYYKKTQKERGAVNQNECILFFNMKNSYFLNKTETNSTQPYVDKDGSLITPSNTIESIAKRPQFVFYDRHKNSFYTNNINNDQEILIRLNQDNGNWELTEETKKIDKYTCLKASKEINGKIYTAWYTPEIPLPYGPIAVNGLKGLILELYTNDQSLSFVFEKLESSDKSMEGLIASYNFEKSISYDEYLELKKKRAEEFRRKALENAPVGARVIEDKECKECNR